MNEYYPYGEEIERLAAQLWRQENPEMSVFDCDATMQEAYRQKILNERKAKEKT